MPEITIPRPFLITVDDVGWWSGRDGSRNNQPFRTGMPRNHVPEDYRALAALGKALNMRIPTGLVLCEWDKTNLLRQLPSATWMGAQWQAPSINQAHKEEAACVIKDAAPYLEPALHGIGHEFWINGRLDRSEFHTSSGRMRHGEEVKKHLDYFFRLMAQNHLNETVRLFVPPALYHGFGNGESGFQQIAASFGIRYVTLVFGRAKCHAPPQFGDVGWENGVAVMDRGKSPIAWNSIAPAPDFDPGQSILPLHWANLLHEQPERNMDVVNAWIKSIDEKIEENHLVPAGDIAQCLTQFLHRTQTRIQNHEKGMTVHMDWIHEVPAPVLADAVFFSIKTAPHLKITITGSQKIPPSSPRENRFLKLRLPKSGKIVFRIRSQG